MIGDRIEKLIELLDIVDDDSDLEDDDSGEPWLGWTDRGLGAGCNTSDLEQDCEDEGARCEDEGSQCDDEGVMGTL